MPRQRLRRVRSWRHAAWLGLSLFAGLAFADEPTAIEAGTRTRGGLIDGTRVIHVTTLADHGEGSLRAALSAEGPRVVVFDVAGTILLQSDLRIGKPYLTIAGQSSPDPGITLLGGQLRIKTHDVVIQHISVLPIHDKAASIRGDVDAISVYACEDCETVGDIRIENVSAGWASDEVIGLWGRSVSNITIRNSIIAEGLLAGAASSKPSSMGLLVGAHVEAVAIEGNLFASNHQRNPVVGAGASAFIANNAIYNPGRHAIHVYGDVGFKVTRVSVIGNVVQRGPDTAEKMTAVHLPERLKQGAVGARFYLWDNVCCDEPARNAAVTASDSISPLARNPFIVETPPVTDRSWTVHGAHEVWDHVLTFAGSRPASRNANDRRIVAAARTGEGHIISDPATVGGYPRQSATTMLPVPLPAFPMRRLSEDVAAATRLEAWLCLRHLEVGGPPTAECAIPADRLRAALELN